jgi:hypothetical protein
VDDRQIPVEDHDVVAIGGRLLQRDAAVAGHVDRHPLPPQTAGDGIGQGIFVFHNQYAHGAHRALRRVKPP